VCALAAYILAAFEHFIDLYAASLDARPLSRSYKLPFSYDFLWHLPAICRLPYVAVDILPSTI
jgi:hypothetical protein